MYKLTLSGSILRKADGAIVSIDFRNVDYQEYQRWLEEGNVTEPADPPPQPSPQAQIDAIERDTMMNRATREFLIALAEKEGASRGLTPEQLMVANKGYAVIKNIDNQIAALRALL